MKHHQELLSGAIEREGEAQRALFDGDAAVARARFIEAAELYRRSWEAAPATSYGRLVGMLKAAVLAGGGREEAEYVSAEPGLRGGDSATAAYARALAALIAGESSEAVRWSELMRPGGEAFARTAAAIAALAAEDEAGYRAAVRDIVADFEARSEHLTGVAIADTAMMLERLAARRGMAANLASPVLPGSSSAS
jgi:hypothetical protein